MKLEIKKLMKIGNKKAEKFANFKNCIYVTIIVRILTSGFSLVLNNNNTERRFI